MNSPPLRECPFCGGEAVMVPGMFLVVSYKVICNHLKNKCAVSPQTKWYTTPAEAVARVEPTPRWKSQGGRRRGMTDNLTNPENVTASAGRDDAITANASPRPWRVDGAFILDSAGGAIAMMCVPDYTCDAALIVDAVNQYDRLAADEARYRAHNVVLRDIVRRILPSLQRDIAQCNGPKQAPRLAALLDEARAAIGEGSANG